MKKQCSLLLFFVIVLSCEHQQTHVRLTFSGSALGTYYNIIFYVSDTNQFDTTFIRRGIDSVLQSVSSLASVYDTASLISRINNNHTDSINDELRHILQCAYQVYEISDGYFDVTVAPLVEAWGFKKRDFRQPAAHEIDSIKPFVGMHLLKIQDITLKKADPRVRIDLNAIAKGYAVDKVAEWLELQGIDKYLVEIGGEVRAGKPKPDGSLWVVAIEKPAETALSPQQEYQRIYIKQISVATSGTYRNYYEKNGMRFSHTIDPKTGSPVSHNMLSATVIASTCMYADALATACMAMGPEKALEMCHQLENVECYFIMHDSSGNFIVKQTTNFQRFFQP